MIVLTTWAALEAVPFAHALLVDRLADFRDQPLATLCRVLIVEPGDTLADLGSALEPEYVRHHNGWYELVTVDGDDGFGRVVLVPAIDLAILHLCRAHTD
jgi:hypothetical protein